MHKVTLWIKFGSVCVCVSCSVLPDSLRPHGLQPSVLNPLPIWFFRKEYWSGLPFPSPGDLPNTGIEPGPPALQADSLPSEPPGGAAARERALQIVLRTCSREVGMAGGVRTYVILVKGAIHAIKSTYFSRRFSASFVNLSASHEEQSSLWRTFVLFLDTRSKNSAH